MKATTRLMAGLLPVVAVIAITAVPTNSKAIAAFARKYNLPCSSCHIGGSYKLTKFGRDFMFRGYATRDAEYISDPSEVKLTDYLSMSESWSWTGDKTQTSASSFNTGSLRWTAGGPLYKKFGFLVGYALTSTTSNGIQYGHLEYNSDHEADTYWFARAGLLAPESLQLQFASSNSTTSNVGGGITSGPSSRMNGIAVGFRPATDTIAEVGYVNGANSPTSGTDDSNAKDVWGSVEQWLDEYGSFVQVGYFKGTAKTTGSGSFLMDYNRWGATASFMRPSFALTGAWFQGNNDLPTSGTRKPAGYTFEGLYNLNNDVTAYVNYTNLDRKLTLAAGAGTTATTNSLTKVLSFGLMQRITNMGRATASIALQDDTQVGGAKTKKTVYSVGLGWMF